MFQFYYQKTIMLLRTWRLLLRRIRRLIFTFKSCEPSPHVFYIITRNKKCMMLFLCTFVRVYSILIHNNVSFLPCSLMLRFLVNCSMNVGIILLIGMCRNNRPTTEPRSLPLSPLSLWMQLSQFPHHNAGQC